MKSRLLKKCQAIQYFITSFANVSPDWQRLPQWMDSRWKNKKTRLYTTLHYSARKRFKGLAIAALMNLAASNAHALMLFINHLATKINFCMVLHAIGSLVFSAIVIMKSY